MRRILLLTVFTVVNAVLFAQPANDNPCGAVSLTAGASCTLTAGTNVAATNTAGVPAPGCASYSGEDVWFSTVVPATGAITIDMTSGTMTDSGLAIYNTSGGCGGTFTLVECDDDDGPGTMSYINNNTLTPGSTVYIRVWDYGGGTGTFNICVQAATACGGGAANNDYCPTPAILTPGPGTFSANTSAAFTADLPGNVNSVFCGSIENNSWYQFTATATTASFPFTSVSGCTSGYGVQAQVYNVTYTAAGCCNTFASVSNCYNPGSTTLGTVNATGLTVGNTYLLMIDGNAGDACNFTISGWTATGILPVVVSQFSGEATEFGNLIQWQTESENKSDYFEVMFSRDANEFSSIGIIQAAGTTTQQQHYSLMHQGAPSGTSFYQLKQVDQNGETTYSDIISVKSTNSGGGLFSVFPIPFDEKLTLALHAEKQTAMQIQIFDNAGKMIFSDETPVNSGTTHYYIDTKTLEQGSYQLVVKSGETMNTQRIIK